MKEIPVRWGGLQGKGKKECWIRGKCTPEFCHSPWHPLAFWVARTHPTLSIAWPLPYPWCVLFHLVLVAMGTPSMSPPEAVLAELVIVTLLASVAESHHALAVAEGTLHRVEDWGGSKSRKNKKTKVQARIRTNTAWRGWRFPAMCPDARCQSVWAERSSMFIPGISLPFSGVWVEMGEMKWGGG